MENEELAEFKAPYGSYIVTPDQLKVLKGQGIDIENILEDNRTIEINLEYPKVKAIVYKNKAEVDIGVICSHVTLTPSDVLKISSTFEQLSRDKNGV